jgi:uncharacterized membrane protein YphA (DoxX/SURF4 family)
MSVALWIAAIVLALAMLGAGSMKLIRSRDQLVAAGMGYAQHFPPGLIKLIGALEVLAAIGLILPALIGIAPILVPLAATGVAILMVGAIITHIRLREPLGKSAPAIVLLFLAVFVAWGRFGA